MESILINENRSAVKEFQRTIDTVITRGQDLIDTFHAFQNFKKIKSVEDFYKLLESPAEYFDEILINNVELKATGNLRPNAELVAKMFDIDRDNFLNLTSGLPISEGCEPCKRTKIIKGQRSISLGQYQQYIQYILFNEGILSVNEPAVLERKEQFKKYAKSPEEIKLVKHYHDLVTILNEHMNQGLCGPANIQEVATLLNLRIVENKVYLNEEILTGLLYKL